MSDLTFSAIMPAYNAERTIAASIQSVLAQTRDDLELIVVDDGSTDRTADVVGSQHDSRVRLLRQRNQGTAAARNTGIAHSRGTFVSFIDNDDLWLPTYLERMAAALAADERAGFAYTDAWVLDDRTRRIGRGSAMAYRRPRLPPEPDHRDVLKALLERNFVFTAASVPRNVIDSVGPLDTRIPRVCDWELWLRIAAHGYRAARVPGRLAVYRLRPDALSRDEAAMRAEIRNVWEIVANEYEVDEEIRERARRNIRNLDAAMTRIGRGRRVLRSYGGRALRRALRRSAWYDNAPPEVAEAFPELTTSSLQNV